MRLSVLTTSFPLHDKDVSGIFVARLVLHLPKDWRIEVLTPASPRDDAMKSHANVTVRCMRYAPKALQLLAHEPGGIPAALQRNKFLYLLLPGLLISLYLHAFTALRRGRVLHANWAICGLLAGAAARLAGGRVVTTLRGEDISRAQRSWLDRKILQGALALSHRVICVSHAIHQFLVEHYPAWAGKCQVIENGVDEVFYRLGMHRLYSAPAVPVIVGVGSLIPRKGFDQLIRAATLLSQPVQVRIAGDGMEGRLLAELAAGKALALDLLGSIQPEDVPDFLAGATVFVLTSFSEGRPNALLEAMAAGMPVVATDIDGVRELIREGETGLLYSPGDTAALAKQLTRLLASEALRRQLGQAAREYLLKQELTWTRTGRRYVQVFDNVQAEH